MMVLKKFWLILMVVVLETVALWVISSMLKWSLMDVLFLGSVGIFAVVWLVLLAMNQSNNAYNGAEKGWTGQNAGEVKQFHVHFSPVMIGMVVFIIISLVVTVIYYAEYF